MKRHSKAIKKMNKKIESLLKAVSNVGGVQFASLLYRSKESGELARHTVLIGFSYHNSVQKSFEALRKARFADTVKAQARIELLASFEKTLTAHANGEQNADYTKKDNYVPSGISGVVINANDNSYKLFGLSVSKEVIEQGEYKEVKSKPLTIAKNTLRKRLPVGKFREFALDADTLERAKVNGKTIVFA